MISSDYQALTPETLPARLAGLSLLTDRVGPAESWQVEEVGDGNLNLVFIVRGVQGSQFTSMDWAAFLRAHNLEHSMSRRGNCHDNAVAESFFNLLKRERIRRRTYRTREDARQDVFDYIEMFYNPKRKHARNGMLSPAEFERQQKMRREGV